MAVVSTCSLPTTNFNPLVGAVGVAAAGAALLCSRDGPFNCSLRTYNVRTMKNCLSELAIWFKTLRIADGEAVKVRSTIERSTSAGGAAFAGPEGFFDGVGAAVAWAGGAVRFTAAIASTRASIKMPKSNSACASSCPSNGAAAVVGKVVLNSSKPR